MTSRSKASRLLVVASDSPLHERVARLGVAVERASTLDTCIGALATADALLIALHAGGARDVARAHEAAPQVPILAFVTEGAEAEGLRALRAGADDVLFLPAIDDAILRAAIDEALARRRVVEREARLSTLVECLPDGISLSAFDGTTLHVNAATHRLLGVSEREIVGGNGMEFVHPDDAARMALEFPAFQSEAGATRTFEFRVQRGDGKYTWLESVATNLAHEPNLRGVVSIYRDITARKRAQMALMRSEANFRALIEYAPTAVLVHRDGRCVYANPALVRLLGCERVEDMIGRSPLELIDPIDHDRVRERLRLVLAAGHAELSEIRFLRRDGAVIEAEAEALHLDFDGEPATVVLARDLSERRALLARLAVADRMLAVGTLAAGVAHEINNPLAYVITNLSLIDDELPRLLDDGPNGAQATEDRRLRVDDLKSLIRDAREGASRVRTIVRDLRALSRPDEEARGPVDLRAVIGSAIKMARTELRHRARVVEEYGGALFAVGNEARLNQVFLNLLLNAAQAIPDGHAEANRIVVRTRDLGSGRVGIEVTDTGVGIPSDVCARIFDPFFTTKPIGAGTGLGLSICHGIVKSLGGDIGVESTVGKGTTVRVTLPAAQAGPVPVDARASAAPARPGRVMVIDDEPFIGSSLRILLAPELDVTALTRASDALARIQAGERFDAILCDLMMPDMNGMEFYRELQQAAPDCIHRLAFLTGGAFTIPAQDFLAKVKPRCLEKPFDVQTLKALLRDVMA